MVSALQRKLVRDLNHLRGQVLTIALVVACGIACFITMRSAFDSLTTTRDHYYSQQRFADVFAHLELAPASLRDRIESIAGVSQVSTRLVQSVMVPMPNLAKPATGTVISLPRVQPLLNAVYLHKGRMLDPDRGEEVLLLEAFARAHGLEPGAYIPAVINGTLRHLHVVGIAMSPEFVLTMPAGGMVFDPKTVAVLWMNENVVAAAFGHQGGFNDVSLRLQPRTFPSQVLADLDRLLAPYGGMGAVGRDKQTSNYMLQGELQQLQSLATVMPMIFLFVAAFLLNVVLSRLITLQRGQIATLKALGYSDWQVGAHYLSLVIVIVIVGALLGIGGGVYLGRSMTQLYTGEFFRFPEPSYELGTDVLVTAVGVSVLAGMVGALASSIRVSRMPPAEAMRPPSPPLYRQTIFERLKLIDWLTPASRMVLRETTRRPTRLLLSAVGIALAIGIVVVSRFMFDAMAYMIDIQFQRAMREDIAITFIKPLPSSALHNLAHLPGVVRVEGLRTIAVRFRVGHRKRDAAIVGYPSHGDLRRLVDRDGEVHSISPQGLTLTSKLAEILGVAKGETVEVDVREGDRRQLTLHVVDTVDESFGLSGHMDQTTLHQLLDEDERVSMALLRIDPHERERLEDQIKDLPWVLGLASPRDIQASFDAQSGQTMAIYTIILTFFASVIAVGVIYNNIRVALSQRSRELASLRVLGFSQSEVAGVLFGEQAIQVALAIPLGLAVGYAMVVGIASTTDPETYRLPIVISLQTYVIAALIAVGSALVSALLVWRKLRALDLIAVLKTRE